LGKGISRSFSQINKEGIVTMKYIWRIIGIVCGFLTIAFETYWFFRWWGLVGAIAGFVIIPLAALFPFIYLFKEGFSLFYFGIWALGIIGMYLGQKDEEEIEESSK